MVLKACSPDCSLSVTWELVKNADSWALAQTCYIRNPGMGKAGDLRKGGLEEGQGRKAM